MLTTYTDGDVTDMGKNLKPLVKAVRRGPSTARSLRFNEEIAHKCLEPVTLHVEQALQHYEEWRGRVFIEDSLGC